MNDFRKGGIKALQTIIDFCNSEIIKIKTSDTEPNTPRQITNGGMLKAYNKVLEKSLNKIESIKSQDYNG